METVRFKRSRPRRRKDGTLSGLEGKVLSQLKRRNATFTYEKERLDYVLIRKYKPDFVLRVPSGKTIYLEVKGYLRPEDRTKMVAVKRCNPHLDIRFIFGRNNRLYKGSPTLYGAWADKHGFKWAVKKIPLSWYKE